MLSQMFWFVLNAVIYQHEKLKKKKKKKKKIACKDFENVNAALNLHLYEGNQSFKTEFIKKDTSFVAP